jgi:hypothetical protein
MVRVKRLEVEGNVQLGEAQCVLLGDIVQLAGNQWVVHIVPEEPQWVRRSHLVQLVVLP